MCRCGCHTESHRGYRERCGHHRPHHGFGFSLMSIEEEIQMGKDDLRNLFPDFDNNFEVLGEVVYQGEWPGTEIAQMLEEMKETLNKRLETVNERLEVLKR